MTWQITVQEINCPFFYSRVPFNNCGHFDNGEKSCIEINCPLKTEIQEKVFPDTGDINNMINIDEMVVYFMSDSGQTQIQEVINRLKGIKE